WRYPGDGEPGSSDSPWRARGDLVSLAPAAVHNVAFSEPPIGKRGYNEVEVDALLDLVETGLAPWRQDNNALRRQVEQLVAGLVATRGELESAKAGASAPAAQQAAPQRDEAPSRRLAPVPPPSSTEQTQATAAGLLGGEN